MTTRRRKEAPETQKHDYMSTVSSSRKGNAIAGGIPWEPESVIVLSMLLIVRLAAATWGIINDCDEVYNYWEPLHLFLYGEGFQTWEYSPVYAIRSYLYIYLHFIPAYLFASFGLSKIAVFTSIRVALGIFCLMGEFYAYNSIIRKIDGATARYFIIFTIFSSGVFQASTAFVPSSFCMALCYYIIGAYLSENWKAGIFCVALSTLVGWPFSAILGLAIVIRMVLVKQRIKEFVGSSLISGVGIGLIQLLVDTYYFGKPVIAPLNIVIYNVLTGPGPSLYGEESLSYYMKNLFVNWNLAILVAAVGFMLSMGLSIGKHNEKGVLVERVSPIIWLTTTAGLWLLIFGTQPHKEERFLFPVYPFIAFFAAIACNYVKQFTLKKWRLGCFVNMMLIVCFIVLSISRVYSIHVNYGSHIDIYRAVNEELSGAKGVHKERNNTIRVCVGKEWHRFPSSFFIPELHGDGNKVEMCFLQSEFRGLLPKPFKKSLSLIEQTRHEPSAMNDLNKEETSRYVTLSSCNYVIDVDMPATLREPDLRELPHLWKALISKPFIDVTRSSGMLGFLRAFYVPYYSEKANVMTTYTLYQQLVV